MTQLLTKCTFVKHPEKVHTYKHVLSFPNSRDSECVTKQHASIYSRSTTRDQKVARRNEEEDQTCFLLQEDTDRFCLQQTTSFCFKHNSENPPGKDSEENNKLLPQSKIHNDKKEMIHIQNHRLIIAGLSLSERSYHDLLCRNHSSNSELTWEDWI